ncbi:hypothetical protein PR048_014056 [Dryococelus australis]|uniref:Reverse transcriptase RNase H-like domain-containing protein n=1 Tax=Dryococelus australis TaxID=614101 RepID=A0ABQ9HTY9_9NEOP|nr:hypothetical protein PR048_014056 [Dryococelus australis]
MAPDVMEPLHNLLGNCVSWKWTDECDKAFLMILFDPKISIILTSDSSSYGVGAILSQLHNGIEKPVAYESAMLNNAQKNYIQLHTEAFSIIYGVTKFHKYLMGSQFTIVTDHEPLLSLFSEKKKIPQVANAILLKWSIIFSSYQYEIQYKMGKNLKCRLFVSSTK